jgi:hypothetical protein
MSGLFSIPSTYSTVMTAASALGKDKRVVLPECTKNVLWSKTALPLPPPYHPWGDWVRKPKCKNHL